MANIIVIVKHANIHFAIGNCCTVHYHLATVIGFVFVCMCLFLQRDAMQARPMSSCGLSVRLSRAWIVSKRVIVSMWLVYHTLWLGFCRAMLCLSTAYAIMQCLSVFVCVCHICGLYQNE